MDPEEVYNLDPLFQLYPVKNFKANLKTLLITPNKKQLCPRPPPWRYSKAKEVLRAIL
jgi:hypothetical protein